MKRRYTLLSGPPTTRSKYRRRSRPRCCSNLPVTTTGKTFSPMMPNSCKVAWFTIPRIVPATGAEHCRNGPGQGKHPLYGDAESDGCRPVFRGGSHVNSQRGILQEKTEKHEKHSAEDEDCNGRGWNGHGSPFYGKRFKKRLGILLQISFRIKKRRGS